jgi:DNA-binding response OmpR family regulator
MQQPERHHNLGHTDPVFGQSPGRGTRIQVKPRIALVDDHTLLAEAFQKLLEPACEVVGTYSDPRAFLLDVARLKPDVVILDISMPLLNGLDTARELRRLLPNTKIIFLTMNEDPDVAATAFRIGASGYLLKRSAGAELLLATGTTSRRSSRRISWDRWCTIRTLGGLPTSSQRGNERCCSCWRRDAR